MSPSSVWVPDIVLSLWSNIHAQGQANAQAMWWHSRQCQMTQGDFFFFFFLLKEESTKKRGRWDWRRPIVTSRVLSPTTGGLMWQTPVSLIFFNLKFKHFEAISPILPRSVCLFCSTSSPKYSEKTVNGHIWVLPRDWEITQQPPNLLTNLILH